MNTHGTHGMQATEGYLGQPTEYDVLTSIRNEQVEKLTRVGVRGHGPFISFFDGRWPRWRVTFDGAVWAGGPALGLVATPLDIDELGLIKSDPSSDGEGVGGKYSKLGESKSRASEAIEMRVSNGTSEDRGGCSLKADSFYTWERVKGQ